MSNNSLENVTVTEPQTEFSVDIEDPWTIVAITLLSMLVVTSFYRIYVVVCLRKNTKRIKTSNISNTSLGKKTNTYYKTRAQMRS